MGARLRANPRISVCLLTISVAALVGCGDDRGLVRVHGRITFDGGPMPGNGYLRFVPLKVAPGFVRRPGMAKFDTDGAFRVQSFEPDDGLFPGEYAIFPFCWEVEPGMSGPAAKSYLPERYVNTTEPAATLTVEPGGGMVTCDIDITSP